MEIIEVRGGRTLAGSIAPPAAKNSVLPLLAATLLCGEPCRLHGVPRLTDVDTSLAILTAAGARAARCGRDIVTRPVTLLSGDIPPRLAGAMRSSVFYLAPLLVRAGQVRLPVPGGCRLGPRPVDIHLDGLAAMGAKVELAADAVILRRAGRLHGADFTLRLPSVGATETLLMAASCAEGTTVLRGAACEPEVEDLAGFLTACGARITGAGTPVIVIQGRAGGLDGCSYTPLPDRIAATTYAAAVAMAGGDITIRRCCPATFSTFLDFLRATGCDVQTGVSSVRIRRDRRVPLQGGQELFAAAWPGFATDAAPLAAAVLLTAQGPSRIYDGLFQNRFACAAGFRALGAQAQDNGRELTIQGDARLTGTVVTAPDLRGGAALVIAALAAEGKTCILDEGHIRRGYQALPDELASLGAGCRMA